MRDESFDSDADDSGLETLNELPSSISFSSFIPHPSSFALFLPHIFKASELFQEGQLNSSGRAVALLAYDKLGDAAILVGLIIDFLAIDKANHICVLLNAPRFSQVAQLRAVLASGFRRA